MVGTHQVNFGKDSAAMQIGSKIVQVGNWVTVWDCNVVQCSVVATQSQELSWAPCGGVKTRG